MRDPHESGSYGYCPFQLLTGRPCPGCGGLRAVNLLTDGEFTAAASSNLLAVVLVLGASVAWLVWFVRRARGIDAPFLNLSSRVVVWCAIAAAVFWILRLTPWGAWLAP